MEKLSIYCLTSLLAFALISSSSAMGQNEPLAENHPPEVTTLEANGSPEEGDAIQATVKLDGLPVVLQTGEQVWEIQSVTTDARSGLIHYFTFAQPGESGEERKVDVPYGALRIYDNRAVLIVERAKLESVPNRRNLSSAEYQENLQNHYGIAPVWSDSE